MRNIFNIILIITASVAAILAVFVVLVLKPTNLPKLNPLGSEKMVSDDDSIVKKDPNKTEMHPITGLWYTVEESNAWRNLRPLGIMVNNHLNARPQSGLIYADVVYEITAEAGITRFLAIFHTNTPKKVGPVRSSRPYYLVKVKEYGDALYMHIGYSPQAEQAIKTWPIKSLAFRGGSFWRDGTLNVATEHTAYVVPTDLREVAETANWNTWGDDEDDFTIWQFKDTKDGFYPVTSNTQPEGESIATDVAVETGYASVSSDPISLASTIDIDFWWPGDYSSGWEYSNETNTYKRWMGYTSTNTKKEHKDRETRDQIEVSNVIVQFADETPILNDDKGRLQYALTGTGDAIIFLDGKAVKATWKKSTRSKRTVYYDLDGNEIQFNRGKFWVSVVPSRNATQVIYK